MKKFILKINENISIYYFIGFLFFFLAICLPTFATPYSSGISYFVLINCFSIHFNSDIYLFPLIFTIISLMLISISFLIYHKKRILFNLTILIALILYFAFMLFFILSDNKSLGQIHVGFYLMLIILLIHAVFTILCFVFKVKYTIPKNKTTKPKKAINGEEFWDDLVDTIANENALKKPESKSTAVVNPIVIEDNADVSDKTAKKSFKIDKELIIMHKKPIIISAVAFILVLILTLSLSLGLAPKIKLTDEYTLREYNKYYNCYVFKFKAENKAPVKYRNYDIYCENDFDIEFYGFTSYEQIIYPNDYVYFLLIIPKQEEGRTEITIYLNNEEVATRKFSY